MRRPELRVYESYLEKSKEFFYMLAERPKERFEMCAIAKGVEEEQCITLTDLITPRKERILITCLEEFRSLEEKASRQYELITTHDRSMLTRKFVKKINGYMQGREHNHPGKRKIPTVGDIVKISECQSLLKPGQKYFVDIIHQGNGRNIFYYNREDLNFIYSKIYREGINQKRIEDWLQRNKKAFSISKYDIVKGK
jgi:hypothetical protein